MIDSSPPPNDVRAFIHKRIGRGLRSFVKSGFNPLAAAGAFIASDVPVRRPPPRSSVARPSVRSAAQKDRGRAVKAMTSGRLTPTATAQSISVPLPFNLPCILPFRTDPATGECKIFLGDQPGPNGEPRQLGPGTPVGNAVMGRYGAALVPGSLIIDRAVCIAGMVLGDDGFCYNRSQIKNSERQWPRGRRPLLTGGDMRAISIASRAASRLTRTAQRLQEIGLIKKPVTRKRIKKKN